ncbi:hypothetical protein EVAR_3680_1 [Eumeta japonica]|uniref:Uncharacterized protein n=1 Tax=Eumeta variegata TaxID=151549 RepID=A0A4C1SU49_EUMVA|nr:hypothetical protein EVAR_3680_1 [Eumeta japonica]
MATAAVQLLPDYKETKRHPSHRAPESRTEAPSIRSGIEDCGRMRFGTGGDRDPGTTKYSRVPNNTNITSANTHRIGWSAASFKTCARAQSKRHSST